MTLLRTFAPGQGSDAPCLEGSPWPSLQHPHAPPALGCFVCSVTHSFLEQTSGISVNKGDTSPFPLQASLPLASLFQPLPALC